MANFFEKILNFLLFRFSFKIETQLDFETTSDIILKRLKYDPSIVEPAFEGNEFSFMHINFLPQFYNYSVLIFEGQIIEKEKTTEIHFKAEGWLFIVIIFYFGVLVFLYDYFIGIDKLENNPFRNLIIPIIPIIFFIPILFLYIYSWIKISQVKSLFKILFLTFEKQQAKSHD